MTITLNLSPEQYREILMAVYQAVITVIKAMEKEEDIKIKETLITRAESYLNLIKHIENEGG